MYKYIDHRIHILVFSFLQLGIELGYADNCMTLGASNEGAIIAKYLKLINDISTIFFSVEHLG